MDYLSHIDLPQEDSANNPAALATRLTARTSGSIVVRSSAGVDAVLGGSLSVQSSVATTGTVGSNPLQTAPGLTPITIPAGKTAKIYMLLGTSGATTAGTTQIGFRFAQGAGANGNLVGCASATNSATNAASAAHVSDGDVVSVAGGASADFLLSIANTSTTRVPASALAIVTNTSTNAVATVTGLIQSQSAGALVGNIIFAIIS